MSLRLHVGCGKRFLPGFIHIDLDDHPHIDHRCRIDQLPMIPDGSAELIYCSHGLQYLDRQEAAAAMNEWHRVLCTGGLLRLAVPNFQALIAVYERTGELNEILGPLYGRMSIRTATGDRVIYHRTVYDNRSLEALCRTAGFRNVRQYDWRETLHKDHDDFSQAYKPHMDKENGILISLNVEAEK